MSEIVDISVIIATHNGSRSIGQTLNSFEKISVPINVNWELIIADNNSTDNTKEIIIDVLQKKTLPLKYILEKRQGKSFALNTALREIKSKIVAFTDDDCIVSSDWVVAILTEFSSDPSLLGIGGRVELYDKEDSSVSIRTYKERIVCSSPGQLFGLISGCNMAFARRVFEEIGEFDPLVGPGGKMGSGDDVDIIYRAYRKGLKMSYVPNVLVYHNHGRRTQEQIRSVNRRYMIGRGAFYCKYIIEGEKDILKMAYWETYSLLRDLIRRILEGESVTEQKDALYALAIGAMRRLINIRS